MEPALAALPGHVLWRARLRVAAELADVLPEGVDHHVLAVLRTLTDGVPRSQQDLARATAVSRTTIGAVAADLVERGLVERVRNPADRRSYLLTPTPQGRASLARWAGSVSRRADHLRGALPAGHSEELRRLLAGCTADLLDPGTPATLVASPGFLLVRLHEHLHRRFTEALAPLDLEPRHFGTLAALEATGAVPQAGLARTLGLSGARVVQLVDDLETRGLVERRRDPDDRRHHLVHLAPAAGPVLSRAHHLAEENVEEVLAALDAHARERLVALLLALVEAPRAP